MACVNTILISPREQGSGQSWGSPAWEVKEGSGDRVWLQMARFLLEKTQNDENQDIRKSEVLWEMCFSFYYRKKLTKYYMPVTRDRNWSRQSWNWLNLGLDTDTMVLVGLTMTWSIVMKNKGFKLNFIWLKIYFSFIFKTNNQV